jgi:hypothetical protein
MRRMPCWRVEVINARCLWQIIKHHLILSWFPCAMKITAKFSLAGAMSLFFSLTYD